MADEGYFRLWNPQWTNSTGDSLIRTNVHGKRRMTFEIAVSEASSAAAELGTAADNALNGTTTPVVIYADSSQALDIDTTIGTVRAVHVIGITVSSVKAFNEGEVPVYSVEEFRMNGATGVVSTRYYLRVMHAYACEWGSGDTASHVAEGNITIQSGAAGGTTYLTIDAESNESNSSGLIYLYEGYWGRWNRCYISANDADWAE